MLLFTLTMASAADTVVCVPVSYDAAGTDCDDGDDRYEDLPAALDALSEVAGAHTIRLQSGLLVTNRIRLDGADDWSSMRIQGDGPGVTFDGTGSDGEDDDEHEDWGSSVALVEVVGGATVQLVELVLTPPQNLRAVLGTDGQLTLDGVTVRGLVGSTMSATAVRAAAGSLVVEDCLFEDWDIGPGGFGGFGSAAGIDTEVPTLVRNSTFLHMEGRNGGSIDASDDLTVQTSTFTDGTASASGGAIRADGGVLLVEDSTFTGNSASSGTLGGGAIVVGDCDDATVAGSTFVQNHADEDGGALSVIGAVAGGVLVQDCAFTENTAGADGAGVYLSYIGGSATSLRSVGNTFEGNVSVDQGGAIGCPGDTCSSVGDTFLANEAAHGGAIYSASSAGLTVSEGRFCDNVATGDGGAILRDDDGALLVGASVFLHNEAGSRGGAIGSESDTAHVFHGTFAANSAPDGAALAGPASLANSLVLDHTTDPLSAVALIPVNAFWDNAVQPGGSGLILADPLVAAPAACTFTALAPAPASPVVDAGSDGTTLGAYEPDGLPVDLPDDDGDGDGSPADEDCDDADPFRHPGATEVCDAGQTDEDCDGLADDDDPDGATGQILAWLDADGDGFGGPGTEALTCALGHRVDNDLDCDDTDGDVSPGEAEQTCNGVDDDCDPLSPDAPDADGDGSSVCEDCDDADPLRSPDFEEVCDEDDVDEDCDGRADDLDPEGAAGTLTLYVDGDGDGYGSGEVITEACDADGASNADDCDDAAPSVNPAAVEVWYDGLDQDCDGTDDDQDQDGHPLADDCDDTDPGRHPGLEDQPDDGIDQDCDGQDAAWTYQSGCGCSQPAGPVGAGWIDLLRRRSPRKAPAIPIVEPAR